MALLTEGEVRAASKQTTDRMFKSATTILKEESNTSRQTFDIFLSHSIKDAEFVLGAVRIIERFGKTVYVDWIVDPYLTRDKVNAQTANALRRRMMQCKSLFYLHSKNASTSRWMPWELGYFDGLEGNVAVVPIVEKQDLDFKGEEYLGVYPYVDFHGSTIWIHRNISDFKSYQDWSDGSDKMRPVSS